MAKRIVNKENCITTTHPQIAVQWHPTLNGELTPNDVRAGSAERVWWICNKGHEWKTEVRVRCQRNNGCPYCSGRNVVKGETDLESQRPDLAKEWDFKENGIYTPDKVSINSPRKVGWICYRGHRWKASIEKRVLRNQGCPYCSGRRAIPGETDIVTQNPEIMHLWDYEKNSEEEIYPENIKPNSEVITWWKCEKGHSWQTKTKYIVRGHRCPYCAGYRLLQGKTDLASNNPQLAKEWHPTKNGEIMPANIFAKARNKYWWLCKEGHEWKAAVYHRNNGENSRGCPYCAGLLVIQGKTDLETKFPEILEDFNYEKNRNTPDEIHWGTTKKVWWKCNFCGHEWRCSVLSRTKHGTGCPKCHGK